MYRTTGKVGIGTTSPNTTLFLKQHTQTAFDTPGQAGISLEFSSSTNYWTIYNSNPYMSFAYNNTRVAYINGTTGAYTEASDARLKTDIRNMENVLERVLQLKPVRYSFNNRHNSGTIGLLAQDVLPLFPEVVSKDSEGDDSYYGIAYSNMSIISIKAIQEQQEIIHDLQSKIDKQNELLEQYGKEINELKQLYNSLR